MQCAVVRSMREPLNGVGHQTDHDLQETVLAALDFDRLDRTAIGVTVLHGIVTLQGRVRNREDVWLAERITQSLPGVRGIANDLEVELVNDSRQTDSMIAEAALNAIGWYRVANTTAIKVIVSQGFVTLTGVVSDMQERGAAERVVRGLRGVRGVWNSLTVGPSHQTA